MLWLSIHIHLSISLLLDLTQCLVLALAQEKLNLGLDPGWAYSLSGHNISLLFVCPCEDNSYNSWIIQEYFMHTLHEKLMKIPALVLRQILKCPWKYQLMNLIWFMNEIFTLGLDLGKFTLDLDLGKLTLDLDLGIFTLDLDLGKFTLVLDLWKAYSWLGTSKIHP